MKASHSVRHARIKNFSRLARTVAALLSRSVVVIFVLLAARLVPAQMIDLNSNGISDVWEQIYGASGLDPNADTDGDGFSNLQEALAGTNPFDSNSYPHITVFGLSQTNFNVTIPAALGKVYQLQSVTNLGSGNWLLETAVVVRAGSALPLLSPNNNSGGKFFRIAISDTNTDGSAMNDWEKYQLGLDPLNPNSNNQLDGNGNVVSDYAYALNKLALQNVFNVIATDPVTTQPDTNSSATDFGQFTVTRTGFPLNAVTVTLGLGGPGAGFASNSVDYATLPTTVNFPAGTSSQTITVVPLANTNLQAPVIVQLKLQSGAGYTLGQNSNASVVIYPSATAKGTGLMGYYYTNSSATYTNAANFNPANLITNRIDPVVDFVWGPTNTPNLSNGLYSVRWVGQVQPQYSETYFFDVNSDDGCKLWVNDQLIINNWVKQNAVDMIGTITLQAGTRYDLKLEYLQTNGAAQAHLSWYSFDQSKQIIPSTSLYPTNSSAATSALPTPPPSSPAR